jgi:putative ABC transport system permease protein
MRFSNLVHLYRVRLRRRLVQELLALVGIAVGVALVFAALVANSSLTGSVERLTSGIVGDTRYQLASRGPLGFDARLLDDVRALAGVRDAAPILEARATVSGPDGERAVTLLGGDPRFARLGGSLLRHFSSAQLARQRAVALPAPLARAIGASYGAPVERRTGARTTRTLLGAQLQAGEIGDLVHSPVVVAPLAYAQRLAGMPGRVTRIFVAPAPGAHAQVEAGLRRLAGDRLNVLPARADVRVFQQAANPTNQSTALFSVFAALVGFLFALSAVLLTVPQRKRFIADLRMAGHTPGVVVQVMLFDALVLGLAGTAVGLALGDLLSRHLFGSVPGYLAFAFPVGEQRVVGFSSVALALAAGLLAACVAVLAPLRTIFADRPPGQRAGAGEPRGGWLIGAGVVCLLASAGVLLLTPVAAVAGMALLTAALLLLLPSVVRTTIEALERGGRHMRSAVPVLAVMELRSRGSRTRTFALAATGAIAVFAGVAIAGSHGDLRRGLDASASEIDGNADVWVTFPGEPNAFATTPLSVGPAVRALAQDLPGVAAVGDYRGGFLDVGDRRAWVLAPPADARAPFPPRQLEEGDVVRATERIRAGGWVVLSRGLADDLDLGVGDAFTLPSPVPTRLRVAGLSTNLGWPPGAIVMNADDYARAWASAAPSALHVAVEAGVTPAVVAARLRGALARDFPVQIETVDARRERHFEAARQGLSRLTQISALVLGAAVLAMATAMGGVLWQRRPTLAGLKVDGFTEFELWRALLLESLVLLGAGCVAGAAFGLGGQVMLSRGLVAITGFPVFYEPGVALAAGILALVIAVALVMLALPGLIAVRVRPAAGGAAG